MIGFFAAMSTMFLLAGSVAGVLRFVEAYNGRPDTLALKPAAIIGILIGVALAAAPHLYRTLCWSMGVEP
jgi:preprotein translocase subunit Sec61beta